MNYDTAGADFDVFLFESRILVASNCMFGDVRVLCVRFFVVSSLQSRGGLICV